MSRLWPWAGKFIGVFLTAEKFIGTISLPENIEKWIVLVNIIPNNVGWFILGAFWGIITYRLFLKHKETYPKIKRNLIAGIRKIEAILFGVPVQYWYSFDRQDGQQCKKKLTHIRDGKYRLFRVDWEILDRVLEGKCQHANMHFSVPIGKYKLNFVLIHRTKGYGDAFVAGSESDWGADYNIDIDGKVHPFANIKVLVEQYS